MPEDLKTKVRHWLERHGAPVELKTARVFQSADFGITQGLHYVDQTTGKIRECDLLAHTYKNSGGSPSVTVCVEFLIECKRSKKCPWIAFTIRDQEISSNTEVSPYSWVMDDLARKELADRIAFRWSDMPNIYGDGPTAYSICQAKVGERNEREIEEAPFGATEQILDALESRMETIGKGALPNSRHLLFPVIVFDGALFEYSLTNGTERLERRSEITLLLRGRSLSVGDKRRVSGAARVKVVTLDSLVDFVARAKAMASWICGLANDIQRDRVGTS